MTKKGHLFYLIKSLNKAEKRHFKRYCSDKQASHNYLLLFDAYDRQKTLNEVVIKAQFKGKAFVKQLHVTKNYLYRLILKSLRSYHSKLSIDAQLKDLLRNIEILFYKELYDQCHYEIRKAEQLADKYEHQLGLLQIYGWKRKIHLAKHGSSRNQDLKLLLDKEQHLVQQMSRHQEYWQLMSSIFHFKNMDPPLPQQKLIRETNEQTPLETQILHHHILYTYFVINRQSEKGFGHLVKLVERMESQAHHIQEDPSAYITVLNNQISYLIHNKEHLAAQNLLEKIRKVPEKYEVKDKKKYLFKLKLRTYNVELEMYRDQRSFDQAFALIDRIKHFIDQNKNLIPQDYLLMYWYQFANIFFMYKDFSQSLRWVNAIIEMRFDGMRKDLERYARLLNLMLHFELDNRIVLRYSIESCRRFLKKQKKMDAFEQVLLKFFAKASNAPKTEQQALLQNLYKQLFDPNHPLVNDNILDYLDFKFWLEYRLHKN